MWATLSPSSVKWPLTSHLCGFTPLQTSSVSVASHSNRDIADPSFSNDSKTAHFNTGNLHCGICIEFRTAITTKSGIPIHTFIQSDIGWPEKPRLVDRSPGLLGMASPIHGTAPDISRAIFASRDGRRSGPVQDTARAPGCWQCSRTGSRVRRMLLSLLRSFRHRL